MTLADRERYHQLHPTKLLVDWGTAIAAGVLLWRRQPLAAAAAGFGPSILASLAFLSGRLDGALEDVRRRPLPRAIAPRLTADVNALRFVGLAAAWAGFALRRPWLVPSGLLVILGGWWLAWRRGVADHPAAAAPGSGSDGAGT